MATEHELRVAYEKGAQDGALAERERLRAFTGLNYIAMPKHDVAEHLAYPEYELRLQHLIVDVEREAERLERTRDQLQEDADRAVEAYSEALAGHRQGREAAGLIGKVKSVVTEPFLREKFLAEAAEVHVRQKSQEMSENRIKLDALRGECGAVSEWLEEMYTATITAGQARAADRAAAARDISPRHFKVFTMAEYLAGDERRRLRWDGAPEVPGGADFGYHWRRDGDDDPLDGRSRGRRREIGHWRAVWIRENQEAAVFISEEGRPSEVWLLGGHIRTMDEAMKFFVPVEQRMKERNSLALLLDAYTDTYLKEAGA